MKDLDPMVFVSVLQEMLGLWFWVVAAIALIAIIGLIAVIARDGRLMSRPLVYAELAGIVGGFAAIFIMQAVTHSTMADIGGPIDWVLGLLVFAVGAVGTTMLAYLAQRALGAAKPA